MGDELVEVFDAGHDVVAVRWVFGLAVCWVMIGTGSLAEAVVAE